MTAQQRDSAIVLYFAIFKFSLVSENTIRRVNSSSIKLFASRVTVRFVMSPIAVPAPDSVSSSLHPLLPSFLDIPIVELEGNDFGCLSSQVSSILTATLAAGIVDAIVIVTIFLFSYRDFIKIILFDKLSLRLFDKQREIEDAKCDVYLLYASQDYYWAQQTLLVGLERKGFRVFDPNRNIDPGTLTTLMVEHALSKSHRTIVLLSRQLFEDEQALAVFHRAETHQDLRLKKRYLVILAVDTSDRYLDNIPTHLSETFERYLRANHFISIHSFQFWARLFYMLPQVPSPPDLQDAPYIGGLDPDDSHINNVDL